MKKAYIIAIFLTYSGILFAVWKQSVDKAYMNGFSDGVDATIDLIKSKIKHNKIPDIRIDSISRGAYRA